MRDSTTDWNSIRFSIAGRAEWPRSGRRPRPGTSDCSRPHAGKVSIALQRDDGLQLDPKIRRHYTPLARDRARAMLHLLTPTDPRRVDAARKDLPGLLSDYAHCELKAAHSALERLLTSALSDARSCERVQLLGRHLPEPWLAQLYTDSMDPDARHHRLFCRLAEGLYGVDEARARLVELAEHEREVVGRLPYPSAQGCTDE